MPVLSNADFLVALAEPTRLRVLNCLAAAPLCVSDLVALLDLPQPTVSRHIRVLRDLRLVRGVPHPPHVIYRLDAAPARARLVRAVLRALQGDPPLRGEAKAALARSRGALLDGTRTEGDAP